jgi:hypothetical protein
VRAKPGSRIDKRFNLLVWQLLASAGKIGALGLSLKRLDLYRHASIDVRAGVAPTRTLDEPVVNRHPCCSRIVARSKRWQVQEASWQCGRHFT